MPERYVSSKRKRLYTRKFDYEEARRRNKAGETQTQLAREYGVSVDAVSRGIALAKQDAKRGIRRLVPGEMLEALAPGKDRCPTCQGPKGKDAFLCQICHQDSRLVPMSVRRKPRKQKVVLADVPLGSIVKHKGRWGVVEGYGGSRKRALHYWDGPAEYVSLAVVVDVAPSLRVFADGEEQESEMVA